MNDAKEPEHKSWTVADLIDFEVLMAEDAAASDENDAGLKARDRGIYLSIRPPASPDSTPDRGWVFHKWLAARLEERFSGNDSPGGDLLWWFGVIKFGLILAGLGMARAMVWSFFHGPKVIGPTGTPVYIEPINTITYWIVCIGITLLLSFLGFWVLSGSSSLSTMPRPPALARSFLLGCLKPVIRRIANRISDELGAERRLKTSAVYGVLRQRLTLRKDSISIAFLCILQLFGLSFACGVLLFSGFDLAFADRIFKWEGTLFPLEVSALHSVIRFVSAPWSWFAPEGAGFPTAEQIRLTKFISTHDLSTFPYEAARAWAMFVVLSALVYGVLPRTVLYILTKIRLKRALNAADFDDPRSDALWERLMTPNLSVEKEREPSPDGKAPSMSATVIPTTSDSHTIIAPSDLNHPELAEAVANYLRDKLLNVGKVVVLPELPKQISQIVGGLPQAPVYLLHESWMWQTGDVTDLLREVRRVVGTKKAVFLALLGKPNREPLGDAPFAGDVEIWKREINAIGDPYLAVTTFLPPQATS